MGKILLLNLLVLFVYMIGLTLAFGNGVLILSCVIIFMHCFFNLIMFVLKLADKTKLEAYSYLLSAVLVLLIGYPSCWGLANMAGPVFR